MKQMMVFAPFCEQVMVFGEKKGRRDRLLPDFGFKVRCSGCTKVISSTPGEHCTLGAIQTTTRAS